MRASRPVCPLVPWRLRLPASQNVVSGLLLVSGVLRVRLARVDQEGHAGLLELLQVIRGLEERGVRDDSGLDQAVECEVEDVPRAEAVAGCAELRDALLLKASEDLVDYRACLLGTVTAKPCWYIKLKRGQGKNPWSVRDFFVFNGEDYVRRHS